MCAWDITFCLFWHHLRHCKRSGMPEREQCTCTSESLHHPKSFQHCGLALPVVVMLIHMHMKVSVHPFCKQFKNQGLVWHLVISTLI